MASQSGLHLVTIEVTTTRCSRTNASPMTYHDQSMCTHVFPLIISKLLVNGRLLTASSCLRSSSLSTGFTRPKSNRTGTVGNVSSGLSVSVDVGYGHCLARPRLQPLARLSSAASTFLDAAPAACKDSSTLPGHLCADAKSDLWVVVSGTTSKFLCSA